MNHERLQSIPSVWLTTKRGFSVIEVLLAVTFFGLTVTALTGGIIYGRQSTAIAGDRDRAIGLAEEGIEAVQSIRDQSFNELRYNQSALEITGNKWSLAGEGTIEQIDSTYYRTVNLYDVCRNTAGDIVGCPGDYVDKNTKRALVSVSWEQRFGVNYSVELDTYLTNWGSARWTQSDWTGGPGQAIWSVINQYYADDGNIDYATSGQIKLKSSGGGGGGDKDWVTRQGEVKYDESDIDFNQGTFSNTVVSGTGVNGKIVLTQTYDWREHTQSTILTTQDINGSDSLSDSNVWACGASGKIYHYDGNAWIEFTDLGSETLYDIDMISNTDGWAVGSSGKFYRYNGSTWSQFVDLNNETIYSLEMVNASSGWAVGSSSKFYYFNGSTWAQFSDLGNNIIYGVDMISASSGWSAGSNGKIYYYNGTAWSESTDKGSQILRGITMISATEGWVGASNGEIYRYNGSTWTVQVDTGSQTWQTIAMVSSSDGWIVGNQGQIFHYNGATWTNYKDTGNTDWRSLVFSSPTKGWLFGGGGNIYYYDNFYQSNGTFVSRIFDSGAADTAWARIYWSETLPLGADVLVSTRTGNTATPDGSWTGWSAELTDDLGSTIASNPGRYIQYRLTFSDGTIPTQTPEVDDVGLVYNFATHNELNDVETIASNDAWAVASGGVILHWNGTGWTVATTIGTDNINAIDAVTASDIWAVGSGGKLYHYNGTAWSESQDTGDQVWNDIYMLSASSGWCVGEGGVIYYYDGTSWTSQASLGAGIALNSVYMVSPTDGWAVGSDGKIYRFNGSAWTENTDTGNHVWHSIYMLSATDGWLAGFAGVNGAIYHWDGTSWTLNSNIPGQKWYSIFMVSATEGWAVGTKGLIYHYDGTSWIEYKKFGNETWNALSFHNQYEGWVVGKNGEIRYYYLSHGGPVTAGNFISSAYNMGSTSSLSLLEWDQTIPVCSPVCTIKIQLRLAPDAGGAPGTWTLWSGDSGAGTYFSTNTGNIPPLDMNGYQWVQYRAEFAGDGVNTPVLDEIRLDYQ